MQHRNAAPSQKMINSHKVSVARNSWLSMPCPLSEFLLPGVSDSATIIFTVLHQAPTRLVCLGQALVGPKHFKKGVEHVKTVPLGKQQASSSIHGCVWLSGAAGSRFTHGSHSAILVPCIPKSTVTFESGTYHQSMGNV